MKQRIENNRKNKTKSLLFEKINKIEKPLTKVDQEKTELTKIRNECGDINTSFIEIKRIVREYSEQLFVNKLE